MHQNVRKPKTLEWQLKRKLNPTGRDAKNTRARDTSGHRFRFDGR